MAGVVTDNRDPDGLARVRVRLPWYEDGATSYWARLAVPMAGDGRGTYFLPEVDDEVLVIAEEGDPSHLYVLGSLWNGKAKPPATNDDGKNNERLIHSRSGHRLRFVDDDVGTGDRPGAEGRRAHPARQGRRPHRRGQRQLHLDRVLGNGRDHGARRSSPSRPRRSPIDADASAEVKASGTLTLKGATVQIN